ncbi:LLM class flavin-dependent oxidoreductase [Nocardioides panacisoli]|uniref:LLM class flavin-dependent oxidoreductase n=1 Tax=Nocardioides panacisoli TaxID=627624 RepID=UPI001C62830F|nr:LLM class flavin-dependent oxidoreductase [Nocardioides panacisoli]QYJ03617.1 LLM class flavin-dependent oxidoreductase [Nocardioides panacisoli]
MSSTDRVGVHGLRGRVEIGLVDLFDGSATRDTEFMATFARTAERCGVDGIWLPEHVVFFDEYTSTYPYPQAPSATDPDVKEQHNKTVDGKARVEVADDQGLLDITQAAVELCGATTRLRIGSSVLLLPLRNPRLFAREVATVSALTGGRFDLGIGVGWSAEEFAACESEFRTRGRRCEELLHQLDAAWSGRDPDSPPLPDVAPPRMLVGGHSPAAIRRAATVATGWYPWNLTVSEFAEKLGSLDQQLTDAGRTRDEVHVVAGFRAVGEIADIPEIVHRYAELGADGVNISLRMTDDGYVGTMEELATTLGLVA